MGPGEEGAGEQRTTLQDTLRATWKQTPLTARIVLTVAVVALVVAMTGITLSEAVVGAATGAAAGIGILQSLWGAEVRTGAVAVALTAVTGGLTGTTAAMLRSLVGAQSLTASAVTGAIAGAVMVAIARAQLKRLVNIMQRVIKKLKWVLVLVKRIKAAVQWCRKVLPTAILNIGSGSAAIAAVSQGTSQAQSVASEGASQAQSAASEGASQAESAALDGASQAEWTASEGASQTEAIASEGALQAESAVSDGASPAESAVSGGTSLTEAAASPAVSEGALQAESAVSDGASPAESAVSGGTSLTEAAASPAVSEGALQAESAVSDGASPAESAASDGALQAESAASEGASEAESAVLDAASPAESAASGGTSLTEAAASPAESAASGGTSLTEAAASPAESAVSEGALQAESAASEGALQAESAASEGALQAESAASEGASQAESAASDGASPAESAASGGTSLTEAATSPAESATSEGASQVESAASEGALQAESAASDGALQAESAVSDGASPAESAASGGTSLTEAVASPAESTVSDGALQAESAASGGTSLTEAAASPAESAVSEGALQAKSAASEGASQAESAASEGASQAESAASEGASQSESAASEGASPEESAVSEGALQAESAASGGTSLTEAAASPAESDGASQAESPVSGRTSQAESAASGRASQPESVSLQAKSAAKGVASEAESAAPSRASQAVLASSSQGASLGASAASGGASLGASAASGASLGASAASGGASLGVSAASGGASLGASLGASAASGVASLGVSAASGVASLGVSAASEGASPAESAVSEGALQAESAASGGTSLTEAAASPAESAVSDGASQAESPVSGRTSQAESAASGRASQPESVSSQAKSAAKGVASEAESAAPSRASQAVLASSRVASLGVSAASGGASLGATLLSQGLLEELRLVEGAKSAIFGSHRHSHLQTEVVGMRDKSPQTDRSWDKKMIEKEQPLLMADSSENAEKCITGSRIPEQMIEDSVKRAIEDIGATGIRQDQHLQEEKIAREKIKFLFRKLHLEGKCQNKLRAAGVLQITKHSFQCHEPCAERELTQNFLQKILMMDYGARYINVDKASQQDHTQQRHTDLSEDIFIAVSLSNKRTTHSDLIHPMDVQMAVFHCADSFLKQLMVTKLSQCQYALPLLVPDPFTRKIEFPLWTFRQINKSWRMRNTNNEMISQTQPIYKAETPMVFFFRFGSVSSSKSQLMNSLINEKHNTFFHRHCSGSSRTRVLMDGVVEIAWFCPSGKNTDKFTDCVAFCNLHGDAGEHEKQLQILTEMSSVNVVLLPRLDRNDKHAAKIQNLYKDKKPLICIFSEDESIVTEMKKGKFKIGLNDRSQLNVSEELRRTINVCLSEKSSTFRLEDVSKHSDIRVDEEDDEDCRRGREAAQLMMTLLEKKDITEIKESFLPHQGKLWHQWSQKNKELHRPQADEKEIDISRKQTELMNIRQQQNEFKISEFMKIFFQQMNSHSEKNMMFFLKWLRILLNEYISANLSALNHKYYETWSKTVKISKKHGKSELKAEQTDLERFSKDLQAADFGLEHIVREIGQIYESCSSVKKNKKDLLVHFSSLPSLAAEMMISGSPLELMDGDAAHVPVIWISAVLDQLVQKLGDQRVFVLSVLGIQSSGKSNMLNAMFGLQFAVSAGRCTRGAFMQLIKVSDEMKTQMNIDYILVVDTEGLGAVELAGRSTKDLDNELATFVVGLGNLTLINIFEENPSEVQDILQIVVQAFMRMKKVRLNPSCVFVLQNITDITTGEKNMERRRRLQQTLDEITKLAAEKEVFDAECFSDVIRFDVQKDVKYLAQFWEGSPPMAPPNPNYCENIQQLKKSILSHVSNLHGMRLTDLKVCIKDLSEALLNKRFVFKFKTALEISVYRKFETDYSKWSWSLCSAMMETENKLYNKIENEVIHEVEETDLQRELKKISEEVNRSMSGFFEKNKDKEIQFQWKTSFELEENIIRKTKSKLSEILQQRDLKKKIDAQRTYHENSLYEKSKELALKLKTKTNDQERLKKKFDLTWKQSVKKTIKDTPAIKDFDVMRDVREILSGIYGASADHWKMRRDVFFEMTYDDYVKITKSSGFVTKAKKFADALSKEHEIQTRALVLDVAHQTDNMIQSFNISKMGYHKSCIQQLTDYIKKKVKHEEGNGKCVFKKQFFIDLVYSICKRANEMITVQQRMFREANDPVIYTEKKREEYYSIFHKHLHGATSAAIFGEIICQKLKEPIEQSIYKKTARDLADEMRSNCVSLNGNRSNLEKHIMKTLAEEEDFNKYMNYINNPRDHFKSFIRNEVSKYITDQFSASVLPKMKENINLLQQKIMEAANEATEYVHVNRGDAGLWLKSFTQQLSDELIFSEKDLSGVKHDVDDFSLLENVMKKELTAVMSEISRRFNTETFPVNLDYKFRPDELLAIHFCQCCWVQCPFCKATCTNTIENHDGDHRVPFHRITGIAGLFYRDSSDLALKICSSAVANRNQYFYPNASDDLLPCTEYRKAGGVLAVWSITPDFSELPYWKWFMCSFQRDLEKYYNKTFVSTEIPDNWRKYSKQDAIESLDQYI